MKFCMILVCMLIAGTYSEVEEVPEYESEIGQPTQYKATGGRLPPKYKSTQSSYSQPRYPQTEQSQYKPPYEQDEYNYCNPRSPPACVKNASDTFCLKDFEYPEKEVQYAIEYDPLIVKKYAELTDQSADNLVDGVTSLGEKHFDYSLYNGNPFARGNWIGGEGYICPSEVLYARPSRAKNVKGEWRVIVQNVAYYTQTQRVETCLYAGASCRTLAPCYRSRCIQKYVYHRMLSFDPCEPERGLFIDIYKLPSACSCLIPAKYH